MLQLVTILVVATALGALSGWSAGFAQVDSTTPPVQSQTPAVISQLRPLVAPPSGISAAHYAIDHQPLGNTVRIAQQYELHGCRTQRRCTEYARFGGSIHATRDDRPALLRSTGG